MKPQINADKRRYDDRHLLKIMSIAGLACATIVVGDVLWVSDSVIIIGGEVSKSFLDGPQLARSAYTLT